MSFSSLAISQPSALFGVLSIALREKEKGKGKVKERS